jgi:LmbE family N-acetylglucosaminyl deacetylase
MRVILAVLFITFFSLPSKAQSGSAILEDMAHFNSFSTVLYMAAHPDDENTRVISWLVNGEHAKTAYLSLTRGDGGQNLIGTEFGDALGILRTQELLAARRIDGGEQFFTRAVDFGYSRSAQESFEKWNEEEVLADAVWVIRKFKPQIILTRFPPDARGGHGHHTASAIIAIKAAEAASDPNRFPEQLKTHGVWQVQSVYWNTSSWWDKTVAEEMDTNKTIWRADIGGYNANMGVSYNELGSLARSQHKCQGFGVDIQRGETFEYFRHLWGKELPNGLAGLEEPSWKSLGAKKVSFLLGKFYKEFDPQNPQNSLKLLTNIYTSLNDIQDDYWRNRKKEECAKLIMACGGLFVEAIASSYEYKPQTKASIEVNLLSRATDGFSIEYLESPGGGMTFKAAYKLPLNQFATFTFDVSLPNETSNPYWLVRPHDALYEVPNKVRDLGNPQNQPVVSVSTTLIFNGVAIPINIPLRYKWRDRVEGELQRDVAMVPELCINFSQPVSVSLNGESVEISASLKWLTDSSKADIQFVASGWTIEIMGSDSRDGKVTLEASGETQKDKLTLKLTPQNGVEKGTLKAISSSGNQLLAFQEIAYSHIPTQVYMPSAEVALTNLNVQKTGVKVGYITGAGDGVADAIAQMGYEVTLISESNINGINWSDFQAVVVGIRAYNTQEWLVGYSQQIFDYIQQGGNYIVQYNTASRFLEDKALIPAPFPFDLSNGRVTEEDSPVTFELPEHPVLNRPNKITQADFDHWVQERGLYFAKTWDAAYATPISWHDTGLQPELGGLIIADFGEGAFMYTGISFFRELPAGVPGAYRLLANLISYEKE